MAILCLIPTVGAQLLVAAGVLSVAIAAPCSIVVALALAIVAGRNLLVRPLQAMHGEYERALHLTAPISARSAPRTARERRDAESMPQAESVVANPARDPSERQRLAGQLVGAIAHDFNNLLATVLGCLELIDRRVEDPDRLRALVTRATDAVDRASRLTSGLVHFARGQPEPARPTDVNTLIAGLEPLISSALGRRIRLLTQLAPDLGPAHIGPAELEAALLGICFAMRGAISEGGQIIIATRGDVNRSSVLEPEPPLPGLSLIVSVTSDTAGLKAMDPCLAQARLTASAAGAEIRFREVEAGGLSEVSLLLPCARCAAGTAAVAADVMRSR